MLHRVYLSMDIAGKSAGLVQPPLVETAANVPAGSSLRVLWANKRKEGLACFCSSFVTRADPDIAYECVLFFLPR